MHDIRTSRTSRRTISLATAAVAVLTIAGFAQPAAAQNLSAAETAAAVAHGPWPPPWDGDASNPVSGAPQAIALGRRLFFDAGLSPSGKVACSSCHRPERAWSDGRARGKGVATSRRNTPTVLDVRLHQRLGWQGERTSLWSQSLRPILDPVEMGSSAMIVQRHMASRSDLATAYRTVFGRSVDSVDAAAALRDAAMALAAFQATLVSARTPFDDIRDALAGSSGSAVAVHTAPARRGLSLFVGRAGCARCHSGPAFTDSRLHRIASTRSAQAYRTPGLRNVARTSPYLHDGTAPTLPAAIRAHTRTKRLRASEIAELAAFLRLLTSP